MSTADRALLLTFTVAILAASANAETRLEIMGGSCTHQLASDSSWHYEYGGYQTNMDLSPKCLQLGLAVLPFQDFGWSWGFRAAYVDLGKIQAHNTYPVNEPEYFRARDSGTAVNSETTSFQGLGGSRGITLGLATEKKLGSVHVGPEAGMAILYSRWTIMVAEPYQDISPGCRLEDWACANGWNATGYVGSTLRYGWLQASFRHYMNVHASQAGRNPLHIGPTTGPVNAFLIGLSIPL